MAPKKPDADLTALFERAPAPDPALAQTLEARLLARFDAVHPSPRRFASSWKPVAFAAGVVCALGAAAQAPIDELMVVGTHLEIVAPTGQVSPGDVKPMVQLLSSGGGDTLTVDLHGTRDPATNTTTLALELWGNTFPDAEVEPTLRAHFPQLANARLVVRPLSGTVRRTLAGVVGEKLFHAHMRQAELDAARAALIATLRAQGVTDDLTVDVQNDGEQVNVRGAKP